MTKFSDEPSSMIDAPGSNGTTGSRPPRLAAKIARQLEQHIVEEGWPVGHYIGCEAELVADMGVSRWTFRDAIRMLAASGLVTTRKGIGGGLYVASSGHESACRLAANYLAFVRVDPEEYGAVLRALAEAMLAQASRASPAHREALRATITELDRNGRSAPSAASRSAFHQMAEMTGNPGLRLLIGILDQIAYPSALYSDFDEEKWNANAAAVIAVMTEMAHAVLDGEDKPFAALAECIAELYCELYASSRILKRLPIDASMRQRVYDIYPQARPIRKVDLVEIQIGEMIYNLGWEPGVNLGSEKELAQRLGVGRWILREALRSLEQLGVVQMGRGSRSGLRVLSPNPQTAVKLCRRQLARSGMSTAQVTALQATFPAAEGDQTLPPIHDLFAKILEEDSRHEMPGKPGTSSTSRPS